MAARVLHDDAGAGRMAVPARAVACGPRTAPLRVGAARHSPIAVMEHGRGADARRAHHDRQTEEPRTRTRRAYHRTRVTAERRERMRARLIESRRSTTDGG